MPTTSDTKPDLATQVQDAEVLLKRAAQYVMTTQPQLDKAAEFAERFDKRAGEVVGVLVDRGIIPPAESTKLCEKLAADRTLALELAARLARLVAPDQFGKQADIKLRPGTRIDGFTALVLYDDPTKTEVDGSLDVG